MSQPALKIITLALTFSFGLCPIGSSQESLWIPAKFGLVLETSNASPAGHFESSERPMIVHIMDAHESFPVQVRIAGLIEFLVRDQGFRHVYEEGNHGPLRTSDAFWFEDGEVREALALRLLDEGKLTGPEFAHVTTPGFFELHGIESVPLYRENVRLEEIVQSQRNPAERELVRLRLKIEKGNFASAGGKAIFIRTLEILRKLVFLKLTPADWEEIQTRPGLLQALVQESPVLAGLSSSAVKFYETARKRDSAMIQNTLKAMEKTGTNRAILVTGGFHTPGIRQYLRAQRINYVVVAPVGQAAIGRSVVRHRQLDKRRLGARSSGTVRLARRAVGAAPVVRKVSFETLRKPNLFNLPAREARMFVDLRGMEFVKGRKPGLYRALERDFQNLSVRIETGKRSNAFGEVRVETVRSESFLRSFFDPPSAVR